MDAFRPATDAARLLTGYLTGDIQATSRLLLLVCEANAQFFDVSDRLVKGDWKVARTWLARQLYRSASGVPS